MTCVVEVFFDCKLVIIYMLYWSVFGEWVQCSGHCIFSQIMGFTILNHFKNSLKSKTVVYNIFILQILILLKV